MIIELITVAPLKRAQGKKLISCHMKLSGELSMLLARTLKGYMSRRYEADVTIAALGKSSCTQFDF